MSLMLHSRRIVHQAGKTAAMLVVSLSCLLPSAWAQSAWPGSPNNTAISITSGGNVGIGTPSPGSTLEVFGNLTLGRGRSVLFTTGDNGIAHRGGIQFLTYDNGLDNIWTPTDQYGNTIDSTVRLGGFGNFNANIVNLLVSGNVGIGTTNPQSLLSVNGVITAKDVTVTNTGWSDYVFAPSYRLQSLREVGAYIQSNHHLPGIPSEAEVQEKGVSVADMQTKLLAKIEELTLHLIAQEKENQDLRGRVARLEAAAAK
jgi:hypothetical protein